MKKYVNIVIVFMLFVSTNTYAYNNINTMLDVDTCSITIHPNDTTIYSDIPIQLQLSTNQEADYYHWYPSTGLSDTTIFNPIATISNSTQYILEAIYESDSNLVYNGDFELGNVGFTTQLNLSTDLWPAGNYNIVTLGSRYHYMFSSCTHNGGNFFVANGASTPNLIVYQTTVPVYPNTDYEFSFESTNVCPTATQNQLSQFQFSVNSQQLGNTFTIPPTPCSWNRFHQIWNSGSNTTAIINILNQNTIAGGNDFGIDNISLRKICRAYDTINITILPTISDVDTCSIRIPDDTTIYSINPVEYQLSTNREADFYKWTPSTGLSNPTISNPIATINNSVQYILEAGFISDTNLVYNGDFELGNVGFTTQYILGTNPLQEGRYGITNYGPTLHNNFSPCTHDGNFYAGNASLYNSLVVFQSQISVIPNTDYYFSAEVTEIDSNSTHPINQLAVFQFNINNIQIGNTLQVNNSPCVWTSYGEVWNSGNNTTATITIKDLNTGQWANDFALDNVSLRTICKAYDTINITLISEPEIITTTLNFQLCEKDFPYTYYDSVFTQAGSYGYSFTTNNIVDSLHIVNITLLPSYNDTIFASICSGETYTENGFNVSDAGFYKNTLTTINGCDSIINLSLNIQSLEDTIINAVICEGTAYNSYGFNESNSGTYYNYYSFGEECERKVVLNLTVIEYPEMLLLPDSVIEVEKYPITIDATCLGCDSYIWNNGMSSPIIDIYSQGTYYVCAISSCGNFCDSVVIVNPDIYVFLPNSFTPVEPTNNIFRYYTAKDEDITVESFQIFNRWGERIFETKEKNKYWDGKYKGNYCPNGVYVWRLLYKTIFTGKRTFEKTGEVNLIK